MTAKRLEEYLNKRKGDSGNAYQYMKPDGVNAIITALSQEGETIMKSRILGAETITINGVTINSNGYNTPIRLVSGDFSWDEFETMRILFLFK